ncbi:glycosyltransferase family 4 protein [Tomitella fengzijianii]|uniref:Glycosyltransferase family 4 protein n=1 Tax=Tomitella fengzijianii TaxID=2597660 RepID=A0A516X7I4_9ACTN|nr:glycosyltransferase family 4 protein [Tomitella fengzijianii]QDQ99010.1 glycosyltransferase family 4 protein [Tomitella fengzijianii]
MRWAAGSRRRKAAGHEGRRPVALWASTSTSTQGGIASYVRTLEDTPLWSQWSITHVCTHRDGNFARKVAVFAAGAAEFAWRILVHRPALVHLHTASYGSFARKSILVWLAAAMRVPVVLHVHGAGFSEFYSGHGILIRAYIRATLVRADRVVALGDSWARRLQRIAPASRIIVIPNAVRVRRTSEDPVSDRTVRVLFLGRVREYKGVFALLDAWRIVQAAQGRRVRLTIAGDGELGAARSRAQDLGLDDAVDFPGWVNPDEVEELLEHSRILVLPSRYEGQPFAVIEAMAHGLCVVASEVGGVPELIADGCGILIPPDDVEALAAALNLVLADRELRKRTGAAAYARARACYDADVVWRRIDAMYRDLVR